MKTTATFSIANKLILSGLIGALTGCASGKTRHDAERTEAISHPIGSGALTPVQPTKLNHPDLSPNATLQDVLAMAAMRHPGMKAAFEAWQAALEKSPQVMALPDPKFSYGYFIREVETRVGPQQQRVGLSQMFPWFGKRTLAGQMADQDAEAAWQVYESTKRKLFQSVKTTWNELAYLHESIRITEENIELMKHFERVAQARFRSGSDVTGVVKAQVEIGKLEDRLLSLQDMILPLITRLNTEMNRPPNTFLPVPKLENTQTSQLPIKTTMDAMLLQHPDLAALQAEVEKNRKSIQLALKNNRPDFTLGLDYIQTDSSATAGISDNGKDPVMITGAFNIPIWNRKNKAAVRQAESNTSAAQLRLKQRENELQTDLAMELFDYRDAERKLGLYKNSLTPLTENALRVAEQSYQAGQSDFLELIDAQRLLLEFQLSYQRALADRAIATAGLEKLLGTHSLLPDSTQSPKTTQP
jgi:cobalt-zinc-cadmium efflux system outer membrane protein